MDNQPEILKQQYQLRFAELQGYRDQVWQVLCADYFARFIPREATILDLGAGWGEFVNHIDAARKFADFLLSPEGGTILSQYGVSQFGHQLFFLEPAASNEKKEHK